MSANDIAELEGTLHLGFFLQASANSARKPLAIAH